MSSNKTPECDEAQLQAQFTRDTPALRAAIGDANGDGTLSAAEISRELQQQPSGPLSNLLRTQAMPALRNVQVEMGALRALSKMPDLAEKVDAQTLQAQLASAEEYATARGRTAVTAAVSEPFMAVHPRSLCELTQEVTRTTDQALRNGFSITDGTKQQVTEEMQRGVMMIKSLNSVEIGSVQVLYDHLATDADKAFVKSGIAQRVKQTLTEPQAPEPTPQALVKPTLTRG